jgi:hypothetical protein
VDVHFHSQCHNHIPLEIEESGLIGRARSPTEGAFRLWGGMGEGMERVFSPPRLPHSRSQRGGSAVGKATRAHPALPIPRYNRPKGKSHAPPVMEPPRRDREGGLTQERGFIPSSARESAKAHFWDLLQHCLGWGGGRNQNKSAVSEKKKKRAKSGYLPHTHTHNTHTHLV